MSVLAPDLRATKATTNPQNPTYWAQKLFGGWLSSSPTGISVTPDSAMTMSAVWAAILILADTLASLPLSVYQRRQEKGKDKAFNHPLYWKLHDQPNDWQTSFEWREMMAGHLELRGNAYSEIIGADDRTQLIPLHPDRVQVVQDGGRYMKMRGQLVYEYQGVSGGSRYIFQEDIHHLRGFSYDGVMGISPIQQNRDAIALAQAAERYGSSFFGNNASPSGVLEHPGQLSDTARANIRESWENRHKGTENAHQFAILEEGMKWSQIGLSAEDAQYIELRNFQLDEVARIFRIPPHMLANLLRSTYSNIEHQDIEFGKHSIRPRAVRWEQALQRDLLSDTEKRTHTIRFTIDGLMRGDLKSRYEAWAVGRQNGWLNGDDIREFEDMNPMPDGQGQLYLVPLNMIPAELAGQGMNDNSDDGRSQREARACDLREQRSVMARQRLKRVHQPLFESAIERYLKREIDRVRRASKNTSSPDGQNAFFEWLDEFYESQRDVIRKEVLPVVATYSAAIGREAAEEVASVHDDLTDFVNNYADKLAEREVVKSVKQLKNIVLDNVSEDVPTAIVQRLDEWREGRAAKTAFREVVRLAGAAAVETYRRAGRKEIKWQTSGNNCPLCDTLNGKVVGIEQYFVVPGDKVEAEGVEPLLVQNHVRHPQLHKGCDCNIVAA